MLIWIVLWVQLRSVMLLKKLKAVAGRLPAPFVFRAASRARFRAHPRRFDARSQFSQRGFGGQFRSARVLSSWARQSLVIQDRGGQGRFGKFALHNLRLVPVLPLGGTFACSGVTCRT